MAHIAFAGLLPVLFAASVAAQTPPDIAQSIVVREDQFLAALTPSHPAVAESAQALARARARRLEASTFENPLLSAEREDPSGPESQTEWTLSWQLPHADRRLGIEAGERGVEAGAADFEQAILNHRLTMRRIYADWALAAERRNRLARHAHRLQALVERETLRAQQGESSGLAARRLALAAQGLESELALMTHAALRARAEARSWNPALPASAEPSLPRLPPHATGRPGATEPSPEGEHPWVRAARLEMEIARLELQAAGRSLRSPELMVGWQRQELGPATVDGSLIGVSWSLPLFQRGQAERAFADARLAEAEALLQRRLNELAARRDSAVESYRQLLAALAREQATREEHEAILHAAEAAFQHGESDLTDLLETLRAVTDSEMALLDLHGEALAAHRELQRLAGPTATPGATPPPPLSPAPQALEIP